MAGVKPLDDQMMFVCTSELGVMHCAGLALDSSTPELNLIYLQ